MKRMALAGLLACAGCSGWQSALDPRSPQAHSLAHLIWLILIVSALIWTTVLIALFAGLRRRERPPPEWRLVLSVWAALGTTVVVIAALTLLSFFTTRGLTAAGSDVLEIEVRGHQWWWEVTYRDFGIKTANEVRVPIGRPVHVRLSSADVIHSFWVPNLAGKQDLIPGRDNSLDFTAQRTGTFRGQCAEFCGVQHAHMAFAVVALEPAAFDAWRQVQAQPARDPSNPEEEAGRQAFLTRKCAGCHTVRGTPAEGMTAPDLTHVASRLTIGAGLFETTRGSFAAWIADPQNLKPGNNMPMVDLSADELRAISAYMMSLR
jgi:cytochrome c oxidase subunit 2